ncbi:PaaI family thioesterase [Candidatus Solincola tengchongensis]|uniref:PaaI family thioesterase n=1 Tax=Candidatus Solincola tengchongensis TaxID=2900693 RepID=UPI00257A9407|nr:PaaI family thioesterase [Candidatus Solincola tengchongensis]
MSEKIRLHELKEHAFLLLNKSPFYLHLGMEVIEIEEGRAKLRLPVKDELKSLYGILHGGVIAALLDSAGTIACGSLMKVGEMAVTVDQRINYISNISSGVLFGEGRALHKGRFTGVAMTEAKDEDGNLVAVGMSTVFFVRGGESQIRNSKDPTDKRLLK